MSSGWLFLDAEMHKGDERAEQHARQARLKELDMGTELAAR
jgi:hypothetical protein